MTRKKKRSGFWSSFVDGAIFEAIIGLGELIFKVIFKVISAILKD